MRISDWSSDVCSSYLRDVSTAPLRMRLSLGSGEDLGSRAATTERRADQAKAPDHRHPGRRYGDFRNQADARTAAEAEFFGIERSEEHTSELQSLMRNSHAILSFIKNTRSKEHTSENQALI